MEDPLVVSVRAADPRRGAEFIRALRVELDRRGAGPARVTIESPSPGGARAGIEIREEDGVEQAAAAVLARLNERLDSESGRPGASAYSPEEEEEVRKRLEDLGYL